MKTKRFEFIEKEKGWREMGKKKKRAEKVDVNFLNAIKQLEDMNHRLQETINQMQKLIDGQEEERRKGVLHIERLQANVDGLTYGLTLAMRSGRAWMEKARELESKMPRADADTVALTT